MIRRACRRPECAQIAKNLRGVFVGQRLTGFEFDDQPVVNKQISKIVTQHSSILIPYLKLALLFYLKASLPQPMGQPILIHLLQMPVPKVRVQIKRYLPDPIT